VVRLRLLDGFELSLADQVVVVPAPTQRLLAFLSLSRRSLHREYVASTLWSERDQQRAAANLRSALWQLRNLTGVVAATRSQVRLGADVVLDVDKVESLARRVLALDGDAHQEAPRDTDLVRALDHDLLPDWYDEWTQFDRERLRQLRIGALERLSRHWCAGRRFALAVDAAMAAIRAEPMRESGHEALIEAHLSAGNRQEAMRRYEDLRRMLAHELGLRPSEALERKLAEVVEDGRRLVTIPAPQALRAPGR
jgi:DNA-binding SARP family transcriptional activator